MNYFYEFNLPTSIIFGTNSIDLLASEIISRTTEKNLNILLVTGKQAVNINKIRARVESLLSTISKNVVVYDGINPEPDTLVVDKGVEIARSNNINLIIGLGGGSVIDVAKSIAGLAQIKNFSCTADYLEIDGTKTISSAGIDFVAIPTVAGSGAELTKNAVLLNRNTGFKRSLRSVHLFPRTTVVDPVLATTVPPRITAISGLDALCHLVEGYTTQKANVFTDMIAVEGVRLVNESLPLLIKDGNDLVSRTEMAQASVYGGIILSHAGAGLAHGIGSVLGAMCKIPHGLACGVLLPAVLKYNHDFIPAEKVTALARLFSVPAKEIPAAVTSFINQIGLPVKLNELGIEKKYFSRIAENSLVTNSTQNNPRKPNLSDVLELLESIL